MTVVVSTDMGGTGATSASAALTALGAASSTVVGALPKVTSIIYPGDDQAANNIGGQTLYLNGSGFLANSNVYINGNAVPSKSFISASNLQFTTPNLTNGIYPVYVVNYDGSTALLVPGLTVSSEPSWNTAAGSLSVSQDASNAWSYSLSANGDSAITYALAAGSSLPTGVSLASNGLISGTITSPPAVDTTYTFSVVATDAQYQDATRQFSVTVTTGEGALFANNVLLIHADGTNNQNNHAFLDSSNNNFTITRNGNATQGSFSPFSQTGWGNYFNGSTDYLTAPSNAAFTFGTGDFTIEGWVYILAAGDKGIFQQGTSNFPLSSSNSVALGINNNGTTWQIYAKNTNANSTATYSLNTWTHFALVRSGTTTSLYINGTSVITVTADSTNYTGTYFGIGSIYGTSSTTINAYISNVRVTKGGALYTANFTPSTTPLTTTVSAGTVSLLTCQSNRFADSSFNAFAITVNGTPSVQAFSPFAPTASYSASTNGGSGYFDGSGDYLVTPSNANLSSTLLGSDFTIECWLYLTSNPSGGAPIWTNSVSNSDGFSSAYVTSTGTIGTGKVGTNEFATTATVVLNAWNHFATVRSGATVYTYLNGAQAASGAASTYLNTSATKPIQIAQSNQTSPVNLTGYISGYRITTAAQYTGSTYTIPTAPPTAISGTNLLLNFTNAGIFDQTAKNVIETVGDAKVSTVQYKYGTASMFFDGTGDYLYRNGTSNLFVANSDFTVECWVYLNSNSGTQIFVGYGVVPWYLCIGDISAGKAQFTWSSSAPINYHATGTTTLSTGQWYHIAGVRYGSNIYLYVNGIQEANTAISGSPRNPSTNALSVGAFASGVSTLNGYLDDVRITKGIARYTSNFTPPTSAFKDR